MTDAARQRLLDLFKARAFSFGHFTLASGKESTYYVNSKKALFHSEAVALLGEAIWDRTKGLNVQAVGDLELGAQMKKSDVTQALQKASQGLLFPSETDAPLEPFEWPGEKGKPDKARVLALAGAAPGTSVKVKGLDAFFADVTEEQDWHDDQERGEV